MSVICDVVIIFPICEQFGEIWKPDSESIVCKIFIYRKTEIKNL